MAYRKNKRVDVGKALEGTPGARVLTVVHISDTHTRHHEYSRAIPDGDVLIHSGDFVNHIGSESEFQAVVADFAGFLRAQPHTHKIFVAGNHDTLFDRHSPEEIRGLMPGIVYLQDSSVTISGLKFYGSPWSNCYTAFTATPAELAQRFGRIPRDTDMLITHMPPRLMLDLAWREGVENHGRRCKECNEKHRDNMEHWGSTSLLDRVLEVQPKCHFFGHVHDDAGIREHGGVVFCNAALDIFPAPRVIRLHYVPREFRWRVVRVNSDHGEVAYVQSVATHCVLDIDAASTSEGASVIAWPLLGPRPANQLWRMETKDQALGDGERGAVKIVSCLNGFALTRSDGESPAVMLPSTDGQSRQFFELDGEGRLLCDGRALGVSRAYCDGFLLAFVS